MGRYSPSPVVMSSPHPQQECMRRLVAVTSMRGDSWYLDPKTVGRPEPLLHGYTGKWSVQVADWEEKRSRYGRPSRLEAELASAPDGGTTLKGQVGPGYEAKARGFLTAVFAAAVPLILLGVFIAGLGLLSSGHVASALPVLLIPAALGGIFWHVVKANRRTPGEAGDDSSARLLKKVAGLLDATIDVPDGATGACPP